MEALKVWIKGIGFMYLICALLVAIMILPVTAPFMLLYTCFYELIGFSVFEIIQKILMIPFRMAFWCCILTFGAIFAPLLISSYFILKLWEKKFVTSKGLIIGKSTLRINNKNEYMMKYIFPYNDRCLALVQGCIHSAENLFDLKIPNDITNLIFIFHGIEDKNLRSNLNGENMEIINICTHRICKKIHDQIAINSRIHVLHQRSDPIKHAMPTMEFEFNRSRFIAGIYREIYVILVLMDDLICYLTGSLIKICLSISPILTSIIELILWPILLYITWSSKIIGFLIGAN